GIRDSSVTGVQTCALPICILGIVTRRARELADRELALSALPVRDALFQRSAITAASEQEPAAEGERRDDDEREDEEPPWLPGPQIGRASCREGRSQAAMEV